MSRRRIDRVAPILVALLLLLAAKGSPPRRSLARPDTASAKLARARIAARVPAAEVGAWHGIMLKIGRPDPFEFKEEDADVEDELVFVAPPTPPALDILAHPRLATVPGASRSVVASPRPPLRC